MSKDSVSQVISLRLDPPGTDQVLVPSRAADD
jgi:hypothetical protein